MDMKIAIVGAGPAGIFTSFFLREFKGEVILFEQNADIGEKLKLTGGGKMNITNSDFSCEKFSSESERLLKNLFKSPWVRNREDLFDELGMKYKWEGSRAILAGESAMDEVERLREVLLKQKNLNIFTGCKVVDAGRMDDGKIGEKFFVKFVMGGEERNEVFDFLIMASGGMFRIKDMGSAEKLYKIPLGFGHSITKLRPSLCPILLPKNPLKDLAGISFKGCVFCPENKLKVCGDILITHSGISGPAVLDFSSMISGGKFELCFIENLNEEKFQKEFWKNRDGKILVKNFLHKFLPNRICDFLMLKNGIANDSKIADVSKEIFKKLSKDLFHYEFIDAKLSEYQFAWTTKGGVPLNEINVATFESRLCKNLYFVGEILDANGLCGGYNISFAAISGKIASEGILKF